MDLYAYAQIDLLDELAKVNGIEVPRLRGYRLMANEKPLPEEEYSEISWSFYEGLICNFPLFGTTGYSEYSYRTDIKKEYYLVYKDGKVVDFNWDRIRGKNRRKVKTAIKNQLRLQKKQADTFNKYVGRNDVLFIHSRIGGGNWDYFGGPELISKDWFIEVVDDAFDSTYCDIYARIKPLSNEEIKKYIISEDMKETQSD